MQHEAKLVHVLLLLEQTYLQETETIAKPESVVQKVLSMNEGDQKKEPYQEEMVSHA